MGVTTLRWVDGQVDTRLMSGLRRRAVREDEVDQAGPGRDPAGDQDRRWAARPGLVRVLGLTLVLLPIIAGAMTALLAGNVVGEPHEKGARVLWWVSMLAASFAASAATHRLCRRAVPLKSLLGMTLVFPDRAPSRLVTARLAGSTKSLQRRVDEARAAGSSDTPTRGAERLLALVARVNNHDRRTRGHCERVRAFAELLGEELHLPVAQRERLRWAALLHDVGKLTVDPAILNKRGAPNEREWEQLKTHPAAGGPLADPLREWLGEWVLAITQHHEKWDGSGYPLGLAHEDISLAGRIVAVADAFEVMTATRSYKQAIPATEARKELTRCAGAHFDPSVVRAFLNISLGDLRTAIGPFAWMAEFPALRALTRAGDVAALAGQAAVVAVATVTAVVAGVPSGAAATNAHAIRTAREVVTGVAATPGPGDNLPIVARGDAPDTTALRRAGSHNAAKSLPTPNSSTGTTQSAPASSSPPPSFPSPDAPTTSAATSPVTSPAAMPDTPTTSPAVPTTSPATVPDAPIAVDDARTNPKNKTVNIDVLANDSDPDRDLDPLSVTIVGGPTGPGTKLGSVTIKATGGRDLLTYSEPDATGLFTIVYQVCDTEGACARATVSVTLS